MLKTLQFLSIGFFLIAGFALLVSAMPTSWEQAPIKSCEAQKKPPGCESDKTSLVSVVLARLGGTIEDHRDDINVVSTVCIAVFTIILGLFTVSLAGSTKVAADAAKKAADIAEQTMIGAQRPYVFVSGVVKLNYDGSDDPYGENQPYVEYVVANYGPTPAILLEARAEFLLTKKASPGIPIAVYEDNPLFMAPILEPGERRAPIKHYSRDASDNDDPESVPFDVIKFDYPNDEFRTVYAVPKLGDSEKLFFRVAISYRGPFTSGHETSACWRYDSFQGFFVDAGKETNYEK